MLPPKGTQPIAKEKLSAEFQAILKRLELSFGTGIRVSVLDPEWVQVSVAPLPAPHFVAQIQARRNMLFGAADSRMQVIQQLTPSGMATYLHMLNAPNWGNPGTEALRGKAHNFSGPGNFGTASALPSALPGIQAATGGTGYFAPTFGKK